MLRKRVLQYMVPVVTLSFVCNATKFLEVSASYAEPKESNMQDGNGTECNSNTTEKLSIFSATEVRLNPTELRLNPTYMIVNSVFRFVERPK